jgi:hypothetical protein
VDAGGAAAAAVNAQLRPEQRAPPGSRELPPSVELPRAREGTAGLRPGAPPAAGGAAGGGGERGGGDAGGAGGSAGEPSAALPSAASSSPDTATDGGAAELAEATRRWEAGAPAAGTEFELMSGWGEQACQVRAFCALASCTRSACVCVRAPSRALARGPYLCCSLARSLARSRARSLACSRARALTHTAPLTTRARAFGRLSSRRRRAQGAHQVWTGTHCCTDASWWDFDWLHCAEGNAPDCESGPHPSEWRTERSGAGLGGTEGAAGEGAGECCVRGSQHMQCIESTHLLCVFIGAAKARRRRRLPPPTRAGHARPLAPCQPS